MLRDLYPQLIKELDKRFKLEETEDADMIFFSYQYQINDELVWFEYAYSDDDYPEAFMVFYTNEAGKRVGKNITNLTIKDTPVKSYKDFNVFKKNLGLKSELIHTDGSKFEEDLDTVVGYVVEAIREALDIRLKT